MLCNWGLVPEWVMILNLLYPYLFAGNAFRFQQLFYVLAPLETASVSLTQGTAPNPP